MSTHTSRALGVIGLGSMGMGAACSAVRQGTPTWGFDPRAEALAAFGEAGGHPAGSVAERSKLWADLQRKLAEDAVNAYIFNPAQVAVSKKNLKGLWASSPIFANDIAAVSWASGK